MPEIMIRGVPVDFPFEPYEVQRAYMEKVIECLQNSTSGMLESPTGTGKTLSLLCSSLGWLMVKKAQLQMNAGGGAEHPETAFVMGLQSRLDSGAGRMQNGEKSVTWGIPKIIYASRTHGQLTQAVQELKRTSYCHVRVTVLGSRDQLCIHPEVTKETNNTNKVHMCRMHVSARSCHFYNNVDVKKDDPTFNDEGILDIEDMVKAGRKLRCCPYYMARELKQKADIIFMPYNYLLDPKTRRAHGVELMNNIVILDEAHNIEKICEESASLQIRSTDVALCIDEVTQVMKNVMEQNKLEEGAGSYNSEPKDFNLDDLALLKTVMLELEKVMDEIPVGTDGTTYPGSYIFDILAKADITYGKKAQILDLIEKIVQFLSTAGTSPFQRKGSGLQKFADLLKIVFSGEKQTMSHIENIRRCYKVHVIVEAPKKQARSDSWGALAASSSSKANGRVLSYWCFSPGFGMQQLMEQGVRCVILTSGTLSPLPPLISELGISIGVQLENPHIIKSDQVCMAVIGKGPDGTPLTSSYASRNDPAYISSLGRTILNFCRVIPHGLLVFFPSYPILKKCQEDWQMSGIWSQICNVKEIFVEPQNKDSFNDTISRYYTQVSDSQQKGACFFAVIRGKVSEGLDFADCNGRAVIITGVPYPPFMDPRVVLKQKYLDETRANDKSGVKCISGAEWYQLEASRAVNQAVGRVIRHANDYGAILLCDYRFGNTNFKDKFSAWLRPHVKVYPQFGIAAKDVREFFRNAEANLPQPKLTPHLEVNSGSGEKQLGSVPASFDTSATRIKHSTGSDKSAAVSSSNSMVPQWSVADYMGTASTSKSNSTDKKPASLFEGLKSVRNVIDFNETGNLTCKRFCSGAVRPSSGAVRIRSCSRRFNIKPLVMPASKELTCECREKSVDGLCTCKLPSTLNVTSHRLEVAGDTQRSSIVNYLKELKRALDVEDYTKFANAFKEYKVNSDYDAFMEKSLPIFVAKENLHLLFKDFARFMKKEHVSQFLKFCGTLSGCKNTT